MGYVESYNKPGTVSDLFLEQMKKENKLLKGYRNLLIEFNQLKASKK